MIKSKEFEKNPILCYFYNMEIRIITDKISLEEVKKMAQAGFGDLVKGVVDIEKEILALGGELHADAESTLLQNGSEQKNLWGINIYPNKGKEEMIEFSSLINIRPQIGNRSIIIESEEIKQKILAIINKLID